MNPRQKAGESECFAHELNRRFQSRRQREKDHSRNLLIVDAAHNKARRPQDQACRLRAFFTGCAGEANERSQQPTSSS